MCLSLAKHFLQKNKKNKKHLKRSLPHHLKLNVEWKFHFGYVTVLFLVVGLHEEMRPSCTHTPVLSSPMHPTLLAHPHGSQLQKSDLDINNIIQLINLTLL